LKTGIWNRYLYTNGLWSVVHNRQKWKQPPCLSTDEWISKMWYIHSIKHYSTLKRNEILIYAMSWGSFHILLSEINQTQGEILCDSTFKWYLK
jgi:hypothetical protein